MQVEPTLLPDQIAQERNRQTIRLRGGDDGVADLGMRDRCKRVGLVAFVEQFGRGDMIGPGLPSATLEMSALSTVGTAAMAGRLTSSDISRKSDRDGSKPFATGVRAGPGANETSNVKNEVTATPKHNTAVPMIARMLTPFPPGAATPARPECYD
jgi:hypothetical protein